jgi:5'-3' exonuclease
MIKKSTLIIDGNYFIFSRLFVLPRPKSIPGLPDDKFMSTEKEKGMLMRKLSIDFASEIRKLSYIVDRIVFTMDSKSWRKDFFPDSGYKANREYDNTIDWNGIREITDEFLLLLEKRGVIVNRVPGAEGDDLIFAWVTHLNSVGDNCVIWSGDKDLIQLVNYNRSTDAYTLWYDNTRNRFVSYPGFKKWLETKESSKDEVDIFSPNANFYLMDQVKNELKQFISKNSLELNDVFCDDFVLEKILTGDKSDNIPSVYEKPSKNGTRTFRLNDKKAKQIVADFKKRHKRFSSVYLFEDDFKVELCGLVSREMKISGKTDEIKEKLELNTKLILLHVATIPDAIQKSMFDSINEKVQYYRPVLISEISNKDKFLDGTKYIDPSYNKKEVNDIPTGGVGGLF